MVSEESCISGVYGGDLELIRQISPFSAIPAEELERVLEGATTRLYEPGDIVADEVTFPKGLCVVMSGVIVAENRLDTRVIALNSFIKGDVFGAATLFSSNEGRYSSLLAAKRPARIVIVPAETVIGLIGTMPGFALALSAYLTGKIRFLNKKLTGYTSKSSVRRLLQYLEVACSENDEGTAKINISSVADQLRMSRTTVYAAAEMLEKAGFIKHEGKFYTLIRV